MLGLGTISSLRMASLGSICRKRARFGRPTRWLLSCLSSTSSGGKACRMYRGQCTKTGTGLGRG